MSIDKLGFAVKYRLLVLSLLLVNLVGCGTFRNESQIHPNRFLTPKGSLSESAFEAAGYAMQASSAESSARLKPVGNAGSRIYDILVLTGGGARGAYAAGVLKGWSEFGRRPIFDTVTGISTGALISVFAFLGEDYDRELEKSYTQTSTKDILTTNYLGFIFGNSLASLKPLKRRIDETVTEQILSDVAEEHSKGRRLYVGTTNLDRGELVIWDMGAIAGSQQDGKLELFKKVLLTSASIPVWFSPVTYKIGKRKTRTGYFDLLNQEGAYQIPEGGSQYFQLHGDGGVAAPLFLSPKLFDLIESSPRARMAKKRVFLIVSGKTTIGHGHPPARANFKGIAAAAVDTMYQQLMLRTIYRLYVVSKNARAEFHMTSIPDDVKLGKDSVSFIPEEMRMLYDLGRKLMRSQLAWAKEPPRLTRYERIR